MEIAEIIKEHFKFEYTDVTNVINIYNDIYAYKVVHVNEVAASQVNYSVIRITEDGKVHNIPSKYCLAITHLLNSKDENNDFKQMKKELEKKIEFLKK